MDFSPLLIPPVGPIFAFLWGAIWGSFANVVIYRLPAGLSVVWPGSRCGSCSHPLGAIDNIPILSYLFLRGRCRHCNASFSPRYAVIEALTALLTLAAYLLSPLYTGTVTGSTLLVFLSTFAFILLLIIISFIDWDTFIVPDVLVIPAIFLGVPITWALSILSLTETLAGLVAGYGIFFATTHIYRIIRKAEGLGLGDAKLLGAIGVWLGPMALAPVIFLASVQGILFTGAAAVFRLTWPNPKPYFGITDDGEYEEFLSTRDKTWRLKPIPFGPFLSLAALEFLFFRPQILAFMTNFFQL
ncbi:prepilin peptidase [Myxococcota bacterium]|nr:prepilin peptidase [Myxococcota bacterium]MBU1534066.1 prepilin peptidase [Myxococcota bacterium]